jgi:hypothetical protein
MMKNLVKGSLLGLSLFGLSNSYALEVHEWGTFTSMVNEEGSLMNGMYHEQEGLPSFVYGLRQDAPNTKSVASQLDAGCNRPHSKCAFPSAANANIDLIPFSQFNTKVTQKMETPVIYFYGEKGEKVHVEVQFPHGMISQWYPAATKLNLHHDQFKQGFMHWDVTLKGAQETENYPKTNAHSIWNPARETKANTILVNINEAEEERFIFYRGLGEFEVPLKISLKDLPQGAMEVTVTNTSAQIVPALFYIKSEEVAGVKRAVVLPALAAYETRSFITTANVNGLNAPHEIQKALVAAGLFEEEAASMVNTWNKSYFHTEGERLLYILPTAWTETILPMKLNPVPEKLVRVLVGRVELFSKAAQRLLSNQLKLNEKAALNDHLLEAKLHAAKSFVSHEKRTELVKKLNN